MGITGLTKLQVDFVFKMTKIQKCLVLSGSPGTGKTIAYGITIHNHVDRAKNYPQVLCLCATYETAIQTQNILCQMAVNSGIKIGSAIQEGTCKFSTHSFMTHLILN